MQEKESTKFMKNEKWMYQDWNGRDISYDTLRTTARSRLA